MTRKLRTGRWSERPLRGRLERAPRDIAPKVTASAGGSALGVVLAWVLTQVPFIDHAPAEVQAAAVILVVSALTFAAGYLKRDTLE